MPPIFLHMAVARDLGKEIHGSVLGGEKGTYLFGATSPDIRVLTRWDRARTHFFDLQRMEHQDSVAGFFAAYPQLRDAGTLDAPTVAFISGYISHLALDETWIEDVYRPYFGQLASLGGEVSADAMDRVLQYELDRRERDVPAAADDIRSSLRDASLAVNVGFLDRETLARWLEIAIDQAQHPPDWERFRFQASRHLRELGIESEDDWRRFRDSIPHLLQNTIEHVSTANIDAFLERGKEHALRAVQGFLGQPA
jgi:hypothetical protein